MKKNTKWLLLLTCFSIHVYPIKKHQKRHRQRSSQHLLSEIHKKQINPDESMKMSWEKVISSVKNSLDDLIKEQELKQAKIDAEYTKLYGKPASDQMIENVAAHLKNKQQEPFYIITGVHNYRTIIGKYWYKENKVELLTGEVFTDIFMDSYAFTSDEEKRNHYKNPPKNASLDIISRYQRHYPNKTPVLIGRIIIDHLQDNLDETYQRGYIYGAPINH